MPRTMAWTWAAARRALTHHLWKAVGRLGALLAAQKSIPVGRWNEQLSPQYCQKHTNALALPAQSRWSEK